MRPMLRIWNSCSSGAENWPVEGEQCVMSKGRRHTRGYERTHEADVRSARLHNWTSGDDVYEQKAAVECMRLNRLGLKDRSHRECGPGQGRAPFRCARGDADSGEYVYAGSP